MAPVLSSLPREMGEHKMSDQRTSKLDLYRIFGTTGVLAGSLLLVALAVRQWSDTPLASLMSFASGVVVTVLAASPFEWLVHRHVYHRRRWFPLNRIHAIHQAHHHAYFPTWRYVTGGPPRRIQILGGRATASTSGFSNVLTRSAHFAFYIFLGLALICMPAWFLTHKLFFLAGTLCGLAMISDLFIRVHDAIHRPAAHRLLQRQFWFRFLDDHHFIHHVDTESNVNFLLPLADLMYGTLRRSLTEVEVGQHGTRAVAKTRLVGAGEPVTRAASRTFEKEAVTA